MEYITITFQEPWFKKLEDYKEFLKLEYNTDTSIPHSNKSEDIVRSTRITNEGVEIIG